jgi:predicted cobalt transporter CbtA
MKAVVFVAITLLSGAIAGTILGIVNQVTVEPYIERAIELEMQATVQGGQVINPDEFTDYRFWQRGGEIVAGTILGLSIGSLFGIIFAYTHNSIPGSNNKKKALILAGIMWFVLFLIPALKYPANPPAVGDPETIYYRQTLYIAFLVISGLSALGLAFLYRKMESLNFRKVIILAAYGVIIAAAYLAMPSNPDSITASMDLVTSFRLASAVTLSMFWGLLGVIFGAFWDKLNPDRTARLSIRQK